MKKKIIAFVLLGLVLALSVATLVLNIVQVDKNELIARPNVVYIYSSETEGNKSGYNAYKIESRNTTKIDEIYSNFNKAFGQSAFSAIFSGSKALTAVDKRIAGVTYSVTDLYKEDIFTLVFYYNAPQTMQVVDKETKELKDVNYDYLFFNVKKVDGVVKVQFGVNTKKAQTDVSSSTKIDIEDDSKKTTYLPYQYLYEAEVNLNELYNYLQTLNLSL